MNQKTTWKGRPLEDLTKEELINVVVELDQYWRKRRWEELEFAKTSGWIKGSLEQIRKSN